MHRGLWSRFLISKLGDLDKEYEFCTKRVLDLESIRHSELKEKGVSAQDSSHDDHVRGQRVAMLAF